MSHSRLPRPLTPHDRKIPQTVIQFPVVLFWLLLLLLPFLVTFVLAAGSSGTCGLAPGARDKDKDIM